MGLVLILLAATGCPANDNNAPDDGGFGCPAETKECVDSQLARVCPADGSGWINKACSVGSSCLAGECVANAPVCEPGEGVCTNATTGMVCKSDGGGYEAVTCPVGTTCTGPGLCQGACVVGSTYCADLQTVASCTDGKVYQSTTCAATERCVRTSQGALEKAECKPAECVPDAQGCDQVCGNRTAGPMDQDPAWVSFCAETPLGYKWTAQKCATGRSCSPSGQVCGPGDARQEAACVGACSPGETRCNPDLSAIETCGVDGNWSSTLTMCASSTYCAITPTGPRRAVCAEPLCVLAWSSGLQLGSCSSDDKIRYCNDEGKLGVEASCPTGRCQASTGMPVIGATAIGVCTVECLVGDSLCLDGGLRRLCVNGLWGAPEQCTAPGTGNAISTCTQLSSPLTGRPRAFCGDADCAPGASQCMASVDRPTLIQYCTAEGQWGIPVECVGYCESSFPALAQCVAECIPGNKVCTGDPVSLEPDSPIKARSHLAMCPSNGRLPADTTWEKCGDGTTCRTSAAGQSLGCVVCVGSSNELGLVDTRCSDDDALQTCAADNTWAPEVACGGTKLCVPPSNGSLSQALLTCKACNDDGWPDSVPCTDAARRAILGVGCPVTVSCPKSASDTTPVVDCCASACTSNPQAAATPAYCVEQP